MTIDRLQSLPILLIITFRPEYQPSWTGQPHVAMVTLNRLSQRERTALVDHITGGKKLPPGLLDQIVERTDGVPLFVEELTKAVLESEQLHDTGDRYPLNQPTQELAIPTNAASLADGARRPARVGAGSAGRSAPRSDANFRTRSWPRSPACRMRCCRMP